MKTITIDGKEYKIECNALTYIKYKSFFKTGILKDMQFIKEYLVKQAVIAEQLDIKDELNEEEKANQLSSYMINDMDEFIVKITQLTWILIYSANNNIETYENWLKSIEKFNVSDDWIAEVTELAVDCFC